MTDNNTEPTDAVPAQEQIEGLTERFRAACLAAVNSGKQLDLHAVLGAILQAPGSRPAEHKIPTKAGDSEPRIETTQTGPDVVGPTVSLAPAPGADMANGSDSQKSTLEFRSPPAD